MIKVASYCRVSTNKDDQANSFESQQRYFKEYIDRQPDWELYEIYADKGITGTSTKKRVKFNQMINDAHMGKFNIIITKEVSRFSRNILDTISYTRELKALGVYVIFLNDGIATSDADAELKLSIMGSLAQEESRKTSARVKWGQARRMEQGVVFGRSMLGYDVKDGKMTVNPEGAEIVKLIFHKYGNEKKGTSVIARELREAGYKSYTGNTKWSNTHIIKILKNEKYVGDLVQKKTITPDYLTHAKKYNHGEEELICIENHHEPIIDRDLWNLVQEELAKRNLHADYGKGHSNRYVFSGKIKCGECGASFVSRQRKRKDDSTYKRWGCITAANEGRVHRDSQGNEVGCDIGRQIREELAMDMLKQSLSTIQMDKKWIINNVVSIAMDAISNCENDNFDSEEKLQYEMEQIIDKKQNVLDAFFSKNITKEDMRMMNERYDKQIGELQERLQAVKTREQIHYETGSLKNDVRKQVTDMVSGLTESEIFYKSVLDQMVVYPDQRVEVKLNLLPQKWIFVLEKLSDLKNQSNHRNLPETDSQSQGVCNNNPSLPTSVRIPVTSR